MKNFIKKKLREEYDNMKGKETTFHHVDIEKETVDNEDYRRILYTTPQMQLVLMSLKPNEEIGEEVHDYVTQFLRFENGEGKVVVNGEEKEVKDGDSVIIPNGRKHNIINTSDSEDLKLYTIYSPPNHPKDTIEKEKSEEED